MKLNCDDTDFVEPISVPEPKNLTLGSLDIDLQDVNVVKIELLQDIIDADSSNVRILSHPRRQIGEGILLRLGVDELEFSSFVPECCTHQRYVRNSCTVALEKREVRLF